MDEAGWLAEADPGELLVSLERAGVRCGGKFYLFNAACCRRAWHLLADPRSRGAVGAVEGFADGGVGAGPMRAAYLGAVAAYRGSGGAEAASAAGYAARACLPAERASVGLDSLRCSADVAWALGRCRDGFLAALPANLRLLREVFGNPFRPVALSPACRTPDVLTLAQAAYEERSLPAGTLEPARLALLADALEDAGCGEVEILGPLRSEGPHVRGCWVIDALLGKS
jgi:hypothetical protein